MSDRFNRMHVRALTGMFSGFEGIPFGSCDVSFDIHPESQDEIDNQRRTHGEKGNINKPGPDAGSGNAQSFAYGGTYAEYLPLNELLHPVHAAN